MSLALAWCGPRASSRRVAHVADLVDVFDPALDVVVLARELPAEVAAAARHLASSPWHLATTMTPESAGGALAAAFADVAHGAAFADDVGRWVDVLAELTGARHVGVRLARATSAMCPRFHVDRVTLRLVTTYVGAGTEYLDAADVDRRRLGHLAAGASDEASGLLRPTATVRRCRAGDVALLKGELWPGQAGRGAVHRSPATVSEAAPRLVLTLDPLEVA